MNKSKFKKKKEKKLIGIQFKYFIDFLILSCCIIIALNIHPSNILEKENSTNGKETMIYIFHDYEGNEYIMNDKIHGASNSWDYLFNDEIPDEIKGDDKEYKNSISLGDIIDNQELTATNETGNNNENIKDNQISINDVMSDLGLDFQDTNKDGFTDSNNSDRTTLIVNDGDYKDSYPTNDNFYTVKENGSGDNSSLIIEKADNNNNDFNKNIQNEGTIENENTDSLSAKYFSFIEEGRVLPTLIPRNDLFFGNTNNSVSYTENMGNKGNLDNGTDINSKNGGVTIQNDYADCMTPRGYKISHGESVLAYQQMEDTPNICNIERRFCWKGKLSGTYSQQGCSANNNYTYEQRGENRTPSTYTSSSKTEKEEFKGGTRQNPDGSVTVADSEIGGSFVFDKPNNIYTNITGNDNIRPEEQEVEETERPHWNCTAPRGEKVKHGQFIQAFKHSNGFNDAPCQAQIRLCTMGELKGTFTESTCKTWDTSFTDWVYGSPTRETYSKEKLELIKKQIKSDERKYNRDRKKIGDLSNDDDIDELLYILDENY